VDDITRALKDHWEWRTRLQKAIVDGTSDLTPREAAATDKCDLGSWLATGVRPELRQTLIYQEVVEHHREFHHGAARVLQLALAGDQDQARAEMKRDSAFGRSSTNLAEALRRWRREGADW